MSDDHIPLDEAARISGLHPVTLRRLLRQGDILGYRDRRKWLVSARSLRAYVDPISGFALDLPGPKIFLTKREDK